MKREHMFRIIRKLRELDTKRSFELARVLDEVAEEAETWEVEAINGALRG